MTGDNDVLGSRKVGLFTSVLFFLIKRCLFGTVFGTREPMFDCFVSKDTDLAVYFRYKSGSTIRFV